MNLTSIVFEKIWYLTCYLSNNRSTHNILSKSQQNQYQMTPRILTLVSVFRNTYVQSFPSSPPFELHEQSPQCVHSITQHVQTYAPITSNETIPFVMSEMLLLGNSRLSATLTLRVRSANFLFFNSLNKTTDCIFN